jgi:NADH:ubiquinone oxidoreductase subunit 5 (subunit L)/multisubunit Na+/H+ antiporter MnhA subunit
MTFFSVIYLLLYVAGIVAFAMFVSRQEDSTSRTRVWIWVLAGVALLLALFSLWIGGAVMIAACFYVADRKNRSRVWALLGLFFGPLALLVLVSLSKLNAGDSLSLNQAAAAGADSGPKKEQ